MRILSAYYFFYYLALSTYAPYLSLYFHDKGFSGTGTGVILSVWALAGVISPPVMGMINDRMRHPLRLLKICTVIAPILSLGFYFLDGYAVFLVLAVLFSWFQNSAAPISDSIAVEVGRREGFSFSNIRLWGALSFSIGSFITGFIFVKSGYETSFLYFFAVGIPIFISLLRFPKQVPPGRRHSLFEQFGKVYRDKTFMLFIMTGLLLNIAVTVNISFLPLYFKEMDFDLSFIGTAYAVAALIEVPVFWISARLVDRFGRFPILCVSAACYAAKCLMLFLFHNIYLTLALQLLDGISYALFAGVAVEVVAGMSGEKTKATYQAVFAALTYGLGGIIGNAAGGAILDTWSAPALYFLLFLLSGTASVLYITIYRPRRLSSVYSHSDNLPT